MLPRLVAVLLLNLSLLCRFGRLFPVLAPGLLGISLALDQFIDACPCRLGVGRRGNLEFLRLVVTLLRWALGEVDPAIFIDPAIDLGLGQN